MAPSYRQEAQTRAARIFILLLKAKHHPGHKSRGPQCCLPRIQSIQCGNQAPSRLGSLLHTLCSAPGGALDKLRRALLWVRASLLCA